MTTTVKLTDAQRYALEYARKLGVIPACKIYQVPAPSKGVVRGLVTRGLLEQFIHPDGHYACRITEAGRAACSVAVAQERP